MERIKRNKFTVSVILLIIVALLATVLFTVFGNEKLTETKAAVNTDEMERATIENHGVGEAEHLAQSGGNNAVLERWGLLGSADYSVVWVSDSVSLRNALGTATAAGTSGANKIIVFTNDITWNQTSIADDVGTQKFVGILDGNGYELNINLTANTTGGNGKKQDNNNAYYMVTQNDLGSSTENFSGTDGNGMRGMGLVVGVNAGTIANMKINYTASGSAMTNVTRTPTTGNNKGDPVDGASLDSASNPDVPYGFGIVTGVNIGTIDNVYVNQKSIFTGNTKSHAGSTAYDNPANAFENCASVGGIAGANMGYGKINNCYMYIGSDIWAQADGHWGSGGSAAYSAAFAGGITGWIRGNNSQITYCYIDGSGNIKSWAMRGKDYPFVSTNYCISFAGGVTTGKFQLYIQSQSSYRYSYVTPQDMGANQVKGIISNWTGERRDSYASGHYMTNSSDYETEARHADGMPFDFLKSADQGNDKQDMIVFTYNYKHVTGNTALDMPHSNYNGSTNGSAVMTSNWIEIYSWTHSLSKEESSVSVAFENGYLRVQANADQYVNSTGVDLDSVTRSTNPSGYMPSYSDTYVGNMIWGMDIYTIGPDIEAESADNITSVVIEPTSKVGSFVRYFNATMTKGSYVVKFGSTYSYAVNDNTKTTRQYDGTDISDMMPSLSLTNSKGQTIDDPNTDYYNWSYITGGTQVALNQTIYPGTYTVQPQAIINGVENSGYVYYDASQRTLAVNKGIGATVIISRATLSLKYYETGWVNKANISVEFSSNGSTNWNTPIIDAYSYMGGTNNAITDLSLVGTNNFTITEDTTTPKNGRQIYNVTAYVKNANADYVAVADTTKAATDEKTVTIRIDNAAPVMQSETYYLASQFGEAGVEEIQQMIAADPGKYTAIDQNDIKAGKWFGEQIVAVVNLGDESRSGVNSSVGVQEASGSSNIFGNMLEENYCTVVGSDGNATVVMRITAEVRVQIFVSDIKGNNATILINEGNSVKIDTTEIALNGVGMSGSLLEVTYGYNTTAGKSFSRIKITFNATFGGSGLNVWYYVDNNTQLGDDVTEAPENATWTKYEFTTNVSSGQNVSIQVNEGMEKAAVFIMFKNSVEESEPIVMRVTTNSHKVFTVDLNGANIAFKAEYITVTKTTTDSEGGAVDTTYNLSQLVNGGYEGVTLMDFFSKTYDGTTALNSNVKFGFTVSEDVMLEYNKHYTGSFLALSEQGNFRTTWIQVVAEYADMNAGSTELRIYMTTTSASNIDMNIQIDYGGEMGTQQTLTVSTRIDRINMAFDISEIFLLGTGIEMSNGTYSVDGQNVRFNWTYGDVFDGLIVRIVNDEDGGSMYFRLNCQGKKNEKYMNVGGNYTAYVDAFMIAGDTYQSEDFSSLVYNSANQAYEGNAGLNYFVSITGSIPIDVAAKEVRLTFALDGSTRYSFSIPYDTKPHTVTAAYKDVDGNTQYAKITWKTTGGASLTVSDIEEIGSYTAVATLADSNYLIKGQSQQTISITATYLDVLVPDKTAQYNDGGAITYIPDLPEGSPAEGQDVVWTIIYYQKLGDSLKVMTDASGNYVTSVTDVGDYYVSVTFDPEKQPEGSKLRLYARKEYTKEGSTGASSTDNYILFSVTPADTVITGVEDQAVTYNKGLQIVNVSGAKVNSKGSGKELSGEKVVLQYWDEEQEAYVDFDATLNNGKYKDVGEYQYRLVYSGNDNYKSTTLDLRLTINAATISGVTFGNTIQGETVLGIKETYNDGKEVSLAADITGSNISKEDNVVIEYRKAVLALYDQTVPSFSTVGRYQVWLRITCPNYVTYETSAYIIIVAAPYPDDALTFDESNKGGILTVDYDGQPHMIKYTVNKEKYGTGISVTESMDPQTEAGVYVITLTVMMTNYEGFTYETMLTINPLQVTEIDDSSLAQVKEEHPTSDTDLSSISVTFKGVDGKDEEAELIFKDEDGNIVLLDAYGCLPAGTYTVTYSGGDNYNLSGISAETITIEQSTGEKPHEHADANGDGVCDLCGQQMSGGSEDCDHIDSDGDGKCDNCGASMGGGSVTPPKESPNIVLYVVLGVCGLLIVASVVGVIVAAVVKSKKKKNNNRYNII